WISIVRGDVVDLIDRDLIIAAPGLTAVECDRRTLIESEKHPLVIGRIDPGDVRVLAARSALERAERLAPVGGSIAGGGDGVNDVGVLRIGPHAGAVRALAVRNARIACGHVLPRGPLIIRAKESRAALN